MSLTNAFNNAVSGLQASARGVGVTSSNIANALVEGYATRRLQVASQGSGAGGVRVTGIARQEDPVVSRLFRQASSDLSEKEPVADFLNAMENAMGLPGDPAGLVGRLAAFEAALIDAADRPDLDYRLATVAATAAALVRQFNEMERKLQAQRLQADQAIAGDVDALNRGLHEVARLNADILRSGGDDSLVLDIVDRRARVVSGLAEIVPIREIQRANGRVALYTAGGQMMLDGTRPVQFGFTPSPAMTAATAVGENGLSGLTADGRPVSADARGTLAGGSLAAHVAIRDTHAPQLQGEFDQLAADLIARFQEAGADPSLPVGAPSLFTDAGAPLADPVAPGIAGRLALDLSVSRQGAAEYWRLRDGLGAVSPAAVGDPSQLQGWLGVLDAPSALSSPGAARSFAEQVAQASGDLGTRRQRAENDLASAVGRHETLHTAMRAGGVDPDTELQQLLSLEKAHAANARVLQVTDDLLRRLMEI